MQCDVTLSIISTNRQGMELQKFYKRSYIVISSDLCNASKKMLDKFSFYRHFNLSKYYSNTDVLQKDAANLDF